MTGTGGGGVGAQRGAVVTRPLLPFFILFLVIVLVTRAVFTLHAVSYYFY